jgi:hypothetical protein
VNDELEIIFEQEIDASLVVLIVYLSGETDVFCF